MSNYLRRKKLNLRGLSWEERNPVDYLFGPSKEDIEWLKNKIKKDDENILKKEKPLTNSIK